MMETINDITRDKAEQRAKRHLLPYALFGSHQEIVSQYVKQRDLKIVVAVLNGALKNPDQIVSPNYDVEFAWPKGPARYYFTLFVHAKKGSRCLVFTFRVNERSQSINAVDYTIKGHRVCRRDDGEWRPRSW